MAMTRSAMDRRIDAALRLRGAGRRRRRARHARRPMPSTTSSAGRLGRRAAARRRAPFYEALFARPRRRRGRRCRRAPLRRRLPGRRVAVARHGAGPAVRPRRARQAARVPPAARRRVRDAAATIRRENVWVDLARDHPPAAAGLTWPTRRRRASGRTRSGAPARICCTAAARLMKQGASRASRRSPRRRSSRARPPIATFPSVEALLVEASLDAVVPEPAEALFAAPRPTDPVARVRAGRRRAARHDRRQRGPAAADADAPLQRGTAARRIDRRRCRRARTGARR